MSQRKTMSNLTMLAAAMALVGAATGSVQAERVKIEAVIAVKAESKLEFADGSKRYLVAIQREGKASGNGPLAGTTMLEWGMHDVFPGIGVNGNGYLVFTTPEGEVAYLKYQLRALPVAGPGGKPQNLINGLWEVVGSSGKLKGLQGAGTLHAKIVSPKERHFILEGDLVEVPEEPRK